MPIKIHDKDYYTVAERLAQLHDCSPSYRVITEVLHRDNSSVVLKASIIDEDDKILATGHAEENRVGNINSTSALENGETSAVGRALAFLGYAGTEIASADELLQATEEQIYRTCWASAQATMKATMDNIDSIIAIKSAIRDEYPSIVAECWRELDQDTQKALWVAPTKGGCFTTAERAYFQSDDYVSARNAINGITVEGEE